jgi:hypothetical protein
LNSQTLVCWGKTQWKGATRAQARQIHVVAAAVFLFNKVSNIREPWKSKSKHFFSECSKKNVD